MYTYFALQANGLCTCDNTYSTPASTYQKVSDSQCNMFCQDASDADAIAAMQATCAQAAAFCKSADYALANPPAYANMRSICPVTCQVPSCGGIVGYGGPSQNAIYTTGDMHNDLLLKPS